MFEAVPPEPDSSLRCLHFSCRHFSENHTWHYHPEYELAYVVESHGLRFVGDSIQPYHPGDLVLLGPNLPHCWSDEGDPQSCAAPPELVVIQFNRDSFGDGFLSLPEARSLRHLLRMADTGLHFAGRLAEDAGALMRGAANEHGLVRLIRTLEILNLLTRCTTVSSLATSDYRTKPNGNPVPRVRLDSICSYIRENLAMDISQAQTAAKLGLSPATFSRLFKSATGRTFVSFVNTLRVNEACRHLDASTSAIIEIAMSCGYNNISNFNRQFLAIKGMSPSEFRQRTKRRSEHHHRYLDAHPQTHC
jgi:AraC-like DNA-binding protein